MSKPPSDSLEDLPSIHLDPGDPGSPDPDCSNPKKQPAAAPSNPSLDSGSLIKSRHFGHFCSRKKKDTFREGNGNILSIFVVAKEGHF